MLRGIEPPDIAEGLAELDRALLTEPSRVDRDQRAVLAAIGVGR